MTHAYRKTARIIVAFGDISGFSTFCDAVTNPKVEYDPIMDAFDQIVAKAERKNGYRLVDTGDGFMCTVDLRAGHACRTAIPLFKFLWRLFVAIERRFAEHRKDSIGPGGFRIIVASGYVERKVKNIGRRWVVLHRGKIINAAHNYLENIHGFGVVLHESARSLVSAQQARAHGLKLRRLKRFPMLSVLRMEPERKKHDSR